jgi:hypothetical protein
MPDDMRIPTRDEDQTIQDADRTRDLVRDGFVANPDLAEILRAQHAETPGALKFDIVEKQGGGDAFVVSRQLLVPLSDGRDSADSELTDRGFVRRGLSADDPRGDPLRDLVWVYSFEDGDDQEARVAVDDAVTFLTGSGVAAAPTMVSALHMVLKSTDGAAPTSVTVDPFTEQEVALTLAQDQIVVAVIDTGIDEHMRSDGWLNEVGRRSNDNVDLLDVFSSLGTPALPILDIGAGHGTFVAGIIRQVDPQAKIVVYSGLDTHGLASEETIASAMIRAALDGVHVINLSLGVERVNGVVPPALEAAVKQIQSLDDPPAIVASAGNNGTEEPVYPAAFDDVVSVGALQAVEVTGQTPAGADWSSHGTWVRCSAVGEGIVSTFVKGQEDPHFGGNDVYPQDSWAVWSGTSFAAPQISAHIAKKCRDDGVSPQAAVAALFPTANLPADGYGTPVVLLPGTRPSP